MWNLVQEILLCDDLTPYFNIANKVVKNYVADLRCDLSSLPSLPSLPLLDTAVMIQGGVKLLGFFIEKCVSGILDQIFNMMFGLKPSIPFPSYNILSSVIPLPSLHEVNPKIFFQLQDGWSPLDLGRNLPDYKGNKDNWWLMLMSCLRFYFLWAFTQIHSFIFKGIHYIIDNGHLFSTDFSSIGAIWRTITIYHELYCQLEERLDRIAGDMPWENHPILEKMRLVVAVIRLLEGICGDNNLQYPPTRYLFEPLEDHYYCL